MGRAPGPAARAGIGKPRRQSRSRAEPSGHTGKFPAAEGTCAACGEGEKIPAGRGPGRPGPLDTAAAPLTRPPPGRLGAPATSAVEGHGPAARESDGARPHPTSNKSKSPEGTWPAGRPWRNRTLKPPEGRLGVGRPPSARGVLRAHSGRRQQPGRPGAHRGTLRACAPPPLPPGLRPRVRGSGFSRHWSLRGAGSAPGRREKACRSLGLGDSGTRGAGRVICLSESEESSEPQDYSSTHAYSERLGAREAERTAAVAERRQSLPGRGGAMGEKAPNSKCSPGAFRGRVLGAKRSTLLGEGKRKSFLFFFLFFEKRKFRNL